MSKIVSEVVSKSLVKGLLYLIFIFLSLDPGLIVKTIKNPIIIETLNENE